MTTTRRIGSLSASVVGLGTNNFGRRLDAERSARVVDAAIEHGINFFDTADIYGGTLSEEYLGKALGPRRKLVLIATKFGLPIDDERKGARPEYVKRAVEDSLKRLGTDYIDLYQLHRPDPEVPVADTLGALDELVRAGKVREIGASNFDATQIEQAENVSSATKSARFVSIQNEYSLLVREPELSVLPALAQHNIAFLPYFPLASGILSGKYRAGEQAPEGTRLSSQGDRLTERFLNPQNLDIAARLQKFAEERGHTLLELAFSWLLTRPTVASVIAGATSAEQVRANVAAANWQLSPEELAEVDRIAPLTAA